MVAGLAARRSNGEAGCEVGVSLGEPGGRRGMWGRPGLGHVSELLKGTPMGDRDGLVLSLPVLPLLMLSSEIRVGGFGRFGGWGDGFLGWSCFVAALGVGGTGTRTGSSTEVVDVPVAAVMADVMLDGKKDGMPVEGSAGAEGGNT